MEDSLTFEIHYGEKSSKGFRLESAIANGRNRKEATRAFLNNTRKASGSIPFMIVSLDEKKGGTSDAPDTAESAEQSEPDMNQRLRLDGSALFWIPSIQINIVDHCNNACSHCAHSAPWLPKRFLSVEEFKKDLDGLRGLVNTACFRFVGGEPFLHPQLLDLLRIARDSKITTTIIVITNGKMLQQIPVDFWDLIDLLHITVYPNISYAIHPDDWLTSADAKIKAKVRKRIAGPSWFTVISLNDRLLDKNQAAAIYRSCRYKFACHMLRDGALYQCANAALLRDRLKVLGKQPEHTTGDGVMLHNNPLVKEQLRQYLRLDQPLPACAYCLGNSGPGIEPQVLDLNQIKKEQQADQAALVREVFKDFKEAAIEDNRKRINENTPYLKPA